MLREMKKVLSATIICAFLISLTVGTQITGSAEANFLFKYIIPTELTIEKPQNNTTTCSSNFVLLCELKYDVAYNQIPMNLGVIVDRRQAYCSQKVVYKATFEGYAITRWEVGITNLYSGKHTIEVSIELPSEASGWPLIGKTSASSTVRFSIDNTPPKICVVSPNHTIYNKSEIELIYTTNEQSPWMGYCIDSQENFTIKQNSTIYDIKDGAHNIVVYANDTAGNMGKSGKVYFTIDTTAPTITLTSPQEKTCNSTFIPLEFNTDEPTSWMGYSIDNKANITLTGNTTLTGLTEDAHNIVVYANDTAGNIGKSMVVSFTVDTSTPSPSPTLSPSPTQQPTAEPIQTAVIISDPPDFTLYYISTAILIIVLALCVVVYLKKR